MMDEHETAGGRLLSLIAYLLYTVFDPEMQVTSLDALRADAPGGAWQEFDPEQEDFHGLNSGPGADGIVVTLPDERRFHVIVRELPD